MFFIFGIGSKSKKIQTGSFLCPVCRTRSSYTLKRQQRYFSLFFIPLIPLSKVKGESVECSHCGTQMPSNVLNYAETSSE